MRLSVPAAVGSLDRVNALVRELATQASLPEWDAYRLRLATEELFMNIVRHGYGARVPDPADLAARVVVIEYGVTDAEVWVRLIDSAPPFDPFGVPVRALPGRPPVDHRTGTLGLDLVRRTVCAATHEYVDGTNRTTFRVRRAPIPPDGGDCDPRTSG